MACEARSASKARLAAVILLVFASAACGPSSDGSGRTVDHRREGEIPESGLAGLSGLSGIRSDSVVLVDLGERGFALVDGMSGEPAAVEVHLADGSSKRGSGTPALWGASAWSWRDSVIVAGQECEASDGSRPLTPEDCEDGTSTVLQFELTSDGAPKVLATGLSPERPPGPIIGDALQIDWGESQLVLETGELVEGTEFALTSGLPCMGRAGFIQVGIDTGGTDVTAPAPVEEVQIGGAQAALLEGSRWSDVDARPLADRIGVGPSGLLGCIEGAGSLLWTFDQGTGKLETFTVDVSGGVMELVPFAPTLTLPGVPELDSSAASAALAVRAHAIPGIDVGDGEAPTDAVYLGGRDGWQEVGYWPMEAGRGRWAATAEGALRLTTSASDDWVAEWDPAA